MSGPSVINGTMSQLRVLWDLPQADKLCRRTPRLVPCLGKGWAAEDDPVPKIMFVGPVPLML